MTVKRLRRPHGSPTGGQFAPAGRPESDLPLAEQASHDPEPPADGESSRPAQPDATLLVEPPAQSSHPTHRVAELQPGTADTVDLVSVVRAAWPDPNDPTTAPSARLSRVQVRHLFARQLPGLDDRELDDYMLAAEHASRHLVAVERFDPEAVGSTPDDLDSDTAAPVDFDDVLADFADYTAATQTWKERLGDHWLGQVVTAVHDARATSAANLARARISAFRSRPVRPGDTDGTAGSAGRPEHVIDAAATADRSTGAS